jgi:hypothetical protein
MTLRDHPLMSYRGIRNWPPVWTCVRNGSYKTATGEIGVLKYVHSNALLSSRLYLVIEHEKDKYVGTLLFDKPPFCQQLSALLRFHLGRTIKEVGDLDLSHTL